VRLQVTFRTVRHMSRIRSTPRMMAVIMMVLMRRKKSSGLMRERK
jgi:hypothetical protein